MITLSHIEKNFGLEPVLTDLNMSLYRGERVGLIGANGSGKSTIMKIIAGIEKPTKGQVAINNGIKVKYLSQIPTREENQTVEERLWQGAGDLLGLEQKLRRIEKEMANPTVQPEETEQLMQEYAHVSSKFEHLGGYSYESRIKQVLQGLRFELPLETPVSILSGGEMARLELALLLVTQPDVLLLDEPTNHLDFSAINWLEDYLIQYNGTVLIISHDRYFLDQTIQRIVEVKNGEAEEYVGNYSYYLEEREVRYEQRLKQYQEQQREIKRKEEAVKRLRQWASEADNAKMFRQAFAIQKQIDRMDKIDRPTLNELQFDLDFSADRSGKEVLRLKNVCKGFDNKSLLKSVTQQVFYGDRIGLIGPNGSGKSTLLKMVMEEMPVDSGEIKRGANVKVAYFDQHQEGLYSEDTILESFRQDVAVSEGTARNILAYYGYRGNDVFKQIKEMSGGERSRLILLKLVYTQVNLLILDEPTNHLDLPSIEILEEALKDFQGTLLVVSHDRYFLNKIVDKVWAFENTDIVTYDGNYDYYRMKQKEKEKTKKEKTVRMMNDKRKKSSANQRKRKGRMRKNTDPKKARSRLEKELAVLETQIALEEAKLDTNQQKLVDPRNLKDFTLLNELKEENELIQKRLEHLWSKWEEMGLQLEETIS